MSDFPAPPRDDGFVIALPGNPSDGMRCTLVDSLTAANWHFRLIYNPADTGSYDWQCIGGAPMFTEIVSNGTFTNTAYTDLTGGTIPCRHQLSKLSLVPRERHLG